MHLHILPRIAFLICKEGATILDEFYAGICDGIMNAANRTDYELMISTAADSGPSPCPSTRHDFPPFRSGFTVSIRTL